jgi:hypothetical protein
MCGVQPAPVNARPLQDQVAKAANQCQPNEVQQLKDRVSVLEKQMNDVYSRLGNNQNALSNNCAVAPQAGCLPPPNVDLSSAPAGKGLETNPQGWPANSVRTAGGYVVVPEGKDAAWSIFGPNQSPGDKPLSRIWGDPHVDEADGQRWDFTKASNFRLPDGTLIDARTTSETGQAVTTGLTIVNGSDRVNIEGINNNRPQLSAVTRDGFDYRANLISQAPNRDTFVLGGTGNNKDGNDRVQWARERNGQIEGVISGTINNVDGKGSYGQQIDQNRQFTVDPSLRPNPFTNPEAWGNQLRGEVVDAASRHLPGFLRDNVVANANLTDSVQRFTGDLNKALRGFFGDFGFGGLGSIFGFGNFQQPFQHAENCFSQVLRQWELQSIFGGTRNLARQLFV